MGTFTEQLKQYLATAIPEQLGEDRKLIEKYKDIGPIVLFIMKVTKKQLKAQLSNEIASKYSRRIKELEAEKVRMCDSWSRLVQKNALLQAENLKLKEELEKIRGLES